VPISLGAATTLLPLHRHVEAGWKLWKARNVHNFNLPRMAIGDLNPHTTALQDGLKTLGLMV
jgi:hypothetical protein